MMLEVNQTQNVKYVMFNYKGSLDYDCDFCKHNSYDNYHFQKNNELIMVVCKECLMKLIEERLK